LNRLPTLYELTAEIKNLLQDIKQILSGEVGCTNICVPNKELDTNELDITETPTPIPLNPLRSRKSIIIHNMDETKTIYLGSKMRMKYSLSPDKEIAIDIGPDLTIYGKVDSGTARVEIMELA